MKKIYLLLVTAVCAICISCEGDEEASYWAAPENPVLVRKITTVVFNDAGEQVQSSAVEFEYEDGRLVSMSDGTKQQIFHYAGTKVTKRDDYENGAFIRTYKYVYEGGKVVSVQHDRSGNSIEAFQYAYEGDVLKYSYHTYLNPDGTIQNGDAYRNTYAYSDGNLVEQLYEGESTTWTRTFSDYDNGANPFRDMNPYIRIPMIGDMNRNNSRTIDSPIQNAHSTRTITYNSNGFPSQINATITSWSGTTFMVISYEYL